MQTLAHWLIDTIKTTLSYTNVCIEFNISSVMVATTTVAFRYQISSDLIGHIRMSMHRRYLYRTTHTSKTQLSWDECFKIIVGLIKTITKMLFPLFDFCFHLRMSSIWYYVLCAAPSIFTQNANKQTNLISSDVNDPRQSNFKLIRLFSHSSHSFPATLVSQF